MTISFLASNSEIQIFRKNKILEHLKMLCNFMKYILCIYCFFAISTFCLFNWLVGCLSICTSALFLDSLSLFFKLVLMIYIIVWHQSAQVSGKRTEVFIFVSWKIKLMYWIVIINEVSLGIIKGIWVFYMYLNEEGF